MRVSDGTSIEAVDSVLWAIGRRPNVAELDLAATGVETARSGAILTDEFQRTSADGVYAIGDVTGRTPLTPVAIAAGRRLADRLFDGQPDRRLSYDCIPSVVFTHPPIGTVGATEAQARADHGDAVRVYRTRFNSMYYAFSGHPRATAMKLVTVGDEERVVGCHVIGEGADEMMQGFAVAGEDGRAKARSRRHRGHPSDERGRARDHAMNVRCAMRGWIDAGPAVASVTHLARTLAGALLAVSLVGPMAAAADQRDPRLEELFIALSEVPDPESALGIEAAIWQIWLDGGDSTLNELMGQGIAAMHAKPVP